MTSKPYVKYAEEYVESVKSVYSESTRKTLLRRLKAQAKAADYLFVTKQIKTTSPKEMKIQDVTALIGARRERKSLHNIDMYVSSSEYAHEIDAMKKIFAHVENPAVEMALKKYPALKPKGKRPRLPSFDELSYARLCEHMERAALSSDFKLVRAYALVGICVEGGTRSKEVRFMTWDDIDRTAEPWIIHIKHVKGEGSYGNPRTIYATRVLRELLTKYEILWKIEYEEFDFGKPILFPSKHSESHYLASNSLRQIKNVVARDIGFDFDLRKCRRSFGQNLINKGVDIEAVSVLMGHDSTKTTEGFYARLPQEDAMKRSLKTINTE